MSAFVQRGENNSKLAPACAGFCELILR